MRGTTKEKTRRRLTWVLAVTCALAAIVSLALLPASASAMPEAGAMDMQEAAVEAPPAEEAAPDADAAPELPAVEEAATEAAELSVEETEPELEPASDEPALEPAATVPIYRLYNWRTSEHLYTSSRTEYDTLPSKTKGDWVQEGIAWYAPDKSRTPVYRLYNPRSGDHHYTTNAAERDMLVRSHGWRSEGTAFYSDDAKRVSILRVYNGRLKRGQHHYTTSASERDSLVANHGWRNEGTGFYGIRVGKTESFRMVPAGTYSGAIFSDSPNWGNWKLTIRSDGSYTLEETTHTAFGQPYGELYTSVSRGNVVMKMKYALDPRDPFYPPVIRPAGPYDFYLDRKSGEASIACTVFRYDPTTDGGCIWYCQPGSSNEYKLVRS